jgi:RNA polymerase-interacting CarD/CdnL/TRCF family regulator
VTFRKGDTVVHPEHGAAVIEEVRVKEFLGEKRKYLVLRVVYGDLTVLVPIDSTDGRVASCVSKNEARRSSRCSRRMRPPSPPTGAAGSEQPGEAALGRPV